jgi:hypothetical protein
MKLEGEVKKNGAEVVEENRLVKKWQVRANRWTKEEKRILWRESRRELVEDSSFRSAG